MSLPQWSCSFHLPKKPLTVGDIFLLSCRGEVPVSFSGAPFVEIDPPYALKILNVKKTEPLQKEFFVTSYIAKPFSNLSFQITDGEKGFQTSPMSWKVQTLLQKDSQPTPPFPPYALSPPLWVWLLLAAVLIFLSYGLFFLIKRYKKKRSLEKLIRKERSGISPFKQFEKNLYQIRTRMEAHLLSQKSEGKNFFSEIKDSFKKYLTVKLNVYVLEAKTFPEMIDLIMKYNKGDFLKIKKETKDLFRELEHLEKKPFHTDEFYWVLEKSRNVAEQIDEKLKEDESGK